MNEVKVIANLMDKSNKAYAGYRVYSGGGISPAITSSGFKRDILVLVGKECTNTELKRI